jgi:CheY-like chemotaxis protein
MDGARARENQSPVVLVVEDEFFIRCDLADRLREAGCVVIEAATAEHAMALCHDGMPVHVLITDIQLNGSGSGWEIAKAFRAFLLSISVIYTSGNASDAARSVPNSLFFRKPYQAADVVRACQQLMVSNGQPKRTGK